MPNLTESPESLIYVRLLDEGTDVWRPVVARRVEGNCYQILLSQVIPNDEQWEFGPGTIVLCRLRTLSGGTRLVAESANRAE